ncbi:MAG: hypothetical protein V1833_03485 [Elusimicrobiota bacterium]
MKTKSISLVILASVTIIFSGISVIHASSWETVEFFTYDWNNDGKPCTFLLETPKNRIHEPGEFTKITIQVPGKKGFALEYKYGLTDFRHYSLSRKSVVPITNNLLANLSKFVVLGPAEKNKAENSLLFVFGWEYASQPGMLYVIALNREKYPEVIFRGQLDLIGIEYMSESGQTKLISYGSYSDIVGWGRRYVFNTYSPRHVYSIKKVNGSMSMVFDQQLTEEYNKKNYAWAGIKPRKDLVVVSFHDGSSRKPEVMNLKDAKTKYRN